MTANLLAPQAVQDKEGCQAKLKQHKQRQAQCYNRGAIDLDPLKRGDTVELKPSQLGKCERQKGIVGRQLDRRRTRSRRPIMLCIVSVRLRLTNEPSLPLSDEILAEISAEVPKVLAPSFTQPHKSQRSFSGEVNPPALSQGSSSLSGSEVPSAVVMSPPKPVLRRSERQQRPPKHFNDFVLT